VDIVHRNQTTINLTIKLHPIACESPYQDIQPMKLQSTYYLPLIHLEKPDSDKINLNLTSHEHHRDETRMIYTRK